MPLFEGGRKRRLAQLFCSGPEGQLLLVCPENRTVAAFLGG